MGVLSQQLAPGVGPSPPHPSTTSPRGLLEPCSWSSALRPRPFFKCSATQTKDALCFSFTGTLPDGEGRCFLRLGEGGPRGPANLPQGTPALSRSLPAGGDRADCFNSRRPMGEPAPTQTAE